MIGGMRLDARIAAALVALVALAGPAAAQAPTAESPAGVQAPSAEPPAAGEPAREAPAADASEGEASASRIKGQAIFKSFSFFEETASDHRNHRQELLLQLEWEHRLAPWADLRLQGELREDTDDYTEGVRFDVPDTDERRSVLGLTEAVLRLGGRRFDVSLGKQLFAWGTADAFNPTDNLNPYDYLDVLDTEKLAVWSVAARAGLGPATLTVVVVPVFTPSRTPLPGSRWNPPPPPGVLVADREVPGASWDNVQFAARLRTTVRGWDLSLSYFEGFEDLPEVRVATIATPAGPVMEVTPVFPRVRVPGADVSTTFGPFEVHAEAAARFVESNGLADRFQVIGGVNYSWDAGLRWLEQVNVIAEYAREVILDRHRGTGIVEAPGLGPDAFRNAAVARLGFKFTEETQLRLTAIVDLAGSANHYTQAKLSHEVTDALHVEAGVDILTGDRNTFWGRFRESDRFFATVKYFF